MKRIEQMIERFKQRHRQISRKTFFYTISGLVLIFATGWALHMTALSMTNDGQKNQPDPAEGIAPASDGEVSNKTSDQSSGQPLLDQPDLQDSTIAQSENPNLTEENPFPLPELSGNPAEDLRAIALSQIGASDFTRYAETLNEDPKEPKMQFVRYCLHEAGIEPSLIPGNIPLSQWMEQLESAPNAWQSADQPGKPGDVIFIDENRDGTVDLAAIVTEDQSGESITGVFAAENVEKKTWSKDQILGFGIVSGRAISTPEKTENPASPTESSSPSHLNVTKIDLQKWSEDDQSWKKTDKGEIQIGDRLQLVLHLSLIHI